MRLRDGYTRFLAGVLIGASGGFAMGTLAATPTARSAGETAIGGINGSARFIGKNALRAVNLAGGALRTGYTTVRGREKYLEHEIEELRGQISRLEQRMD